MLQDFEQDLTALKEWMSKEPHLPPDLDTVPCNCQCLISIRSLYMLTVDDKILLCFLHTCYYSLEKTKKRIDQFCSLRAQMPEVYSARDPLSPAMQTMFNHTSISSYRYNEILLCMYKYDDPTLENFQLYNILKSLAIQVDVWMKSCQPLAEQVYLIFDMKCFSLKMIPKVNIVYLRDFLMYLFESYPMRVTKVIGINAPSFYDKLYAIVRPVLPTEIQNIIHFYTDLNSLYQLIDRKYLPKEYGGEAQSMYEQNQEWCKRIIEERIFLMNESSWSADLTKKIKSSDNSMSGSFRTLPID